MRAIRSAWVPSLSWKVTPASFAAMSSSRRAAGRSPRRTGRRPAGRQHPVVAGEDRSAVVGGLAVGHDDVAGAARLAGRGGRRTSGSPSSRSAGPRAAGRGSAGRSAEQRHRPFDQPGDLGQQAGVGDQLQAPGRRRWAASCAMPLPLGRVEDDEARAAWRRSPSKEVTANGSGARKRWPRSGRAATKPSISSGTTSAPVSRVSRQRIGCSGRTQRSVPSPQRMDFGQGKARTAASTVSATISAAGRPGLVQDGDQTRPSCRRGCPAGRGSGRSRAGSHRARGGASARGPLRSSRTGQRARPPGPRRQRQAARGGEGPGVGIGQAALDQAVGDQAAQVVGGPAACARGFPRRRARAAVRASVSRDRLSWCQRKPRPSG